MSASPIEILLVDNDPEDIRVTLDLFREIKLNNRVYVVNDSRAALTFLRQSDDVDATYPDIILLDPCLPHNDGSRLIRELRRVPELANIPVVFLLTPDVDCDTLDYSGLSILYYTTKPLTAEALFSVVKSINGLWVSIVQSEINPPVDRV